MKTSRIVLILTLLFSSLAALCAFGQPTNPPPEVVVTNSVSTNVITLPPGVKQAVGMLGPKLQEFVTKAIVVLGSIGIAIAPFAPWIRRRIWDWMNSVAESADVDDDVYLARLFGNPLYKFTSFLLRFARVDLPTEKDLERAIGLQAQAVAKAIDAPVSSGGS